MTVTNTNSSVSYPGDDVSTDFPTTFRFLEDSHLTVTLIDEDEVETALTLGTHYNVDGAGDDEPGGSVEMITPPATGETLLIERNTTITQETSFGTFTKFSPETHEEALDKLTMIAQEGARRLAALEALGNSLVSVATLADAAIVDLELLTDANDVANSFPVELTVPNANLVVGLQIILATDLDTGEVFPEAPFPTWVGVDLTHLSIQNITGLTTGRTYAFKFLAIYA